MGSGSDNEAAPVTPRSDAPDGATFGWYQIERPWDKRARDKGDICYWCGQPLGRDEPVCDLSDWRRRWPVCVRCGEIEGWTTERTEPCAGCARPVHWAGQRTVFVDGFFTRGGAWHPFCCSGCKNRYYARRAKAKRAKARRRQCVVCGSNFQPSRADAKTCSGACRQRAYRRRGGVPLRLPDNHFHELSDNRNAGRDDRDDAPPAS